jgi:outer membrane receptor protein involved in Fe transport
VYIRGGESKYNAVMVDGISMNDFGGSFDMASLPADGIDRVEVTRGPQSALYGPNTLTGVINIVSRSGDGPPRFTALAEGGSYATRRFATGGTGLTKGLSWSYNLSRVDSDGVVQNDNYRNQSAFLSLGYRQGSQRQFDFRFFAPMTLERRPFGSGPERPVLWNRYRIARQAELIRISWDTTNNSQPRTPGYHGQPCYQRYFLSRLILGRLE